MINSFLHSGQRHLTRPSYDSSHYDKNKSHYDFKQVRNYKLRKFHLLLINILTRNVNASTWHFGVIMAKIPHEYLE